MTIAGEQTGLPNMRNISSLAVLRCYFCAWFMGTLSIWHWVNFVAAPL